MKTILFLMALMLLSWDSLIAQDAQNEAVIPFQRDGLWGLIDGTGRETLPPTFRELGWFSEGIAPARRGGYWGYVDTRGQWVIQPQYDYAIPFQDSLAVVWVDSFPIAINLTGQVVVPRGYATIKNYGNGILGVVES